MVSTKRMPLHACALTLLAFMLAPPLSSAGPGPFALLHSIKNPGTNVQSGVWHGWSVASNGRIAAVGAPFEDQGGDESGIVNVYDADNGELLHTLINPSLYWFNLFGQSVAISGSRLVVGAPSDDTAAANAGSAYVYDLELGTPMMPIATLRSPNPAPDDHFGEWVAIDGMRVVVGAPGQSLEEFHAGGAFVYDLAKATPAEPVAILRNPSPARNDRFGYSVAISGMRVVIWAPFDDTGALDAGSAYVFDLASPTPTSAVATLTNPSRSAFDVEFGSSIAISGTRVVMGAPFDDTGGPDVGSAYVFDLASATPSVPVTTLTNPSPSHLANFGSAVSISGSRVIVGAPYSSGASILGGSVHAFDLASATPPLPTTRLNNPAPDGSDNFGYSVCIFGTKAIVGAPFDNTLGPGAGGAYVFDLAGALPAASIATLYHPSPEQQILFGQSVAISGSRTVVGAPRENTGMTNAGSVYLYELDGGQNSRWGIQVPNPNPGSIDSIGDSFGAAVAISGLRMVAGAPGDDAGAQDTGSVYVFDLAGGTPAVPTATLRKPGAAARDAFGFSVAISGTRVVAGTPNDDTDALDAGSVCVFDIASVTPSTPTVTLTNPSPALEDYFGQSVAISGSQVVVGAYRDDTAALDAGSAYVFDLAGTAPAATLANPSPGQYDFFGLSVAISGSRIVVGAPYDDTGAINSGSIYVFDLASVTPSIPTVTLTNPSPAREDYFGQSVAISGSQVVVGAYQDDTEALSAGVAYVYRLDGPNPLVPVARLASAIPRPLDYFGTSVATDAETVVVGSPKEDLVAVDRGAVYIFGPWPELEIAPTTPGFATISWKPFTTSGFALQFSESFAPGEWLDAPSRSTNPVIVPTTNMTRFFRLVQP